jgi:hypothetical protein
MEDDRFIPRFRPFAMAVEPVLQLVLVVRKPAGPAPYVGRMGESHGW